MEGNNGRKNCKYGWIAKEFDDYCKGEAEKIRIKRVINADTATITKALFEKVILPNKISIMDIYPPPRPLMLQKKKWKRVL